MPLPVTPLVLLLQDFTAIGHWFLAERDLEIDIAWLRASRVSPDSVAAWELKGKRLRPVDVVSDVLPERPAHINHCRDQR